MALCTFLSFLACSLGLGPCGGGRAAISIGTATGMSISSRWGFCSDTPLAGMSRATESSLCRVPLEG